MADRKSKQRPESKSELSELGKYIHRQLKKNRKENKTKIGGTNKPTTQKELADTTHMSESKLSRIMHLGSSVIITLDDVFQIAIALKLTKEELDELLCAAFPIATYQYVYNHWGKYSRVTDWNIELDGQGLQLLRNQDLEY
ncbi:MAG: helix-turn-helix domain-containing protein [Clostridiales bacterium]|nr:helix-turn-helix domain-containing protein [Clostridiales bacterium]